MDAIYDILVRWYLYIGVGVFLVTSAIVGITLVSPTRRAPASEKARWQRTWLHVEVAMLVAYAAGVLTVIPDAVGTLTESLSRSNQVHVDARRAEVRRFAENISGRRCADTATYWVCPPLAELLSLDDTSPSNWSDISERISGAMKGNEKDEGAYLELQNLVFWSQEVAGFAEARDVLASVDPIPLLPTSLSILWPFFVAVGFALNCCKAIAAYSFV